MSGKQASATARPHHNLEAWPESMQLVAEVYRATTAFPDDERFGLTSQMRRAAVSIPSNVAEGAARNGKREFLYAVGVARGSLAELDTQLLVAAELDYLSPDHRVFERIDRVSRLLTGLHKHLSKTERNPA